MFLTTLEREPATTSSGFSILSCDNINTQTLAITTGSACKDIDDCRTLIAILWSCVATLAACTWVSVHPNVPSPGHGQFALAIHRIKLMLLAIIAPEIIVLWALRQRMVASELYHAHGMTMAHGFFVSMGGFVKAQGRKLCPIPSHAIGDTVDPKEICGTRTGEILDHSKGDEVTKGLAMLQTVWFMSQCIARRVQHLPLTELEVVTLAFSAVNIVIYVIWWDKPLDVRYPIRIGPPPDLSAPEVVKQKRGPSGLTRSLVFIQALQDWIDTAVRMFIGDVEIADLPTTSTRVPTLWAGRLGGRRRGIAAVVAALLAIGFGGIHFAAWNTAFPTAGEKVSWRVASIIVVAVPTFLFFNAVVIYIFRIPPWCHRINFFLVIPLCILVYVAARGALMVLPFTSLRSLPIDAYKDIEWTKFVSHVA